MATPLERLLVKTSPAPGGCLIYTGGGRGGGFGAFWFEGANQAAHRVAWLLQVGPIDAGHVVAQSCGDRRCVALGHLDAVPAGRPLKTRCTHGHEMTDENTYRAPGLGSPRRCRICRRSSARR